MQILACDWFDTCKDHCFDPVHPFPSPQVCRQVRQFEIKQFGRVKGLFVCGAHHATLYSRNVFLPASSRTTSSSTTYGLSSAYQ